MKSFILFSLCCLLLAASCNHNPDPQPDPAELLIGKWKRTSVYYLDSKTGKYTVQKETDPNYFIYEFSKPDTLFTYYLNENEQKKNCPHSRNYQLGKFQPDSYFTLDNQLELSSSCPNGDASIVFAFNVTEDTLVIESPIDKFQYTYLIIK